MTDRPMGRRVAEDARDQLYSMRMGLGATSPPIVDRDWTTGPILDQGAGAWLNSCVGHACFQLKASEPTIRLGGLSADAIYRRCLDLDEFDGTADTGTSVRAGLKVLQEEGIVESYLWAETAYDVRDWVIAKGPVIVGTTLTEYMRDPIHSGTDLFMRPIGRALGGHAYLLSGYSVARQAFRVTNSWGSAWAEQGRAWLAFHDFANLFVSRGEAVGIVEVALPAPPPLPNPMEEHRMQLEDRIVELDEAMRLAQTTGAPEPPEGAEWGGRGIVDYGDGVRCAYRAYAILEEITTADGSVGIYTLPDASGLSRFP